MFLAYLYSVVILSNTAEVWDEAFSVFLEVSSKKFVFFSPTTEKFEGDVLKWILSPSDEWKKVSIFSLQDQ